MDKKSFTNDIITLHKLLNCSDLPSFLHIASARGREGLGIRLGRLTSWSDLTSISSTSLIKSPFVNGYKAAYDVITPTDVQFMALLFMPKKWTYQNQNQICICHRI